MTFPLQPYKSLENEELAARIQKVRDEMGKRLLILGHHYQQDEVIALSDLRGDSYRLSELAAADKECRAIVFCGVHFMAETADILANRPERLAERGGQRVPVVLPDLAAGCSMADMAEIEQVEDCWQQLGEVIDTGDVMPVTYVNSAASLKAFCGRHGGIVCTSANAAAVLQWAFARRSRVLFFPDQHLGRNTALAMGIPLGANAGLGPAQRRAGRQHAGGDRREPGDPLERALQRPPDVPRRPTSISSARSTPGIKILVHPECMMEVVVQGRRDRLHRPDHPPGGRSPAGHALGHRHRAAPGQPAQARAPRAGDPLPLAGGLHVRDDVPDRPGPPVLGAGEPGGRHAGERHRGRSADGRVRPGSPPADAGSQVIDARRAVR